MASLFIFLHPVGLARAEPTTFDTYTTAYSQYRDAHDTYEKTKNTYKQFGTLKSKTDAEVATKSMLILRSQTLISFLKLLHERIGSVNEYNADTLAFLDQEIAWYSSNLDTLNNTIPLEDLVSNSDSFQDHYASLTQSRIPLSITLVNHSLLSGFSQNAESEIIALAQKIPNLPENLPVPQIQKNLVDAKIALLQANELTSQIKLIQNPNQTLQTVANRLIETQKQAKTILSKSYAYLIEIEQQIYQ